MAVMGKVGSYRRKGHTYWRIRIKLDGELREVYRHKGVQFTSAAHAQAVLEQIRGRLADATNHAAALAEFLPKRSKPNLVLTVLQDYVKEMRQRLKLKEISQHTLANLLKRVPGAPAKPSQHFGFWAGVSVHEIKPRHLEKFKQHLQGLGIEPSSVRLSMDQFHGFLGWCVREELIVMAPQGPQIKVPRKRPELYTPSEQRRVLERIPWAQRGIFLALCLGMRPNAARALRVEDAQRGFLHVHRATQSDKAGAEPSEHTKGWRESWVPMSRDLAAWIEEHSRNRMPTAALFWNPSGRTPGQGWAHKTLGVTWNRAAREAGLPHVPLYKGTKHSFATGRLLAGKSKDALGEFMQISRAQVDTYAQWARELSAEVLDAGDLAEEAQAKILELRGR